MSTWRRPWLDRRMFLGVALAGLLWSAQPASAATLEEGLARYTPKAVAQIDRARDAALLLKARVAAGDVAGAQEAWKISHVDWERSETFTGALYPELDEAIDAWPDAKSGYHALEARLFAGDLHSIGPALDALVAKLQEFSREIRAKGLTAQGLLNGTAKLTFEIGENKAAGGESAASGTSLTDMQNNVAGVDQVFTEVFEPVLRTKNPKLAEIARAQLDQIEALVNVADLKSVDQPLLGKMSERFAINLQAAAAPLGLETPSFED